MATITIPKGSNLSQLAKQYGTTVPALVTANPSIKNPNLIQAGASLTIPDGTAPGASQEKPAGDISGTAPSPYSGLDNLKMSLRSALNEAASKRVANNYEQLAPLAGGVPGTIGSVVDMIRAGVKTPVETTFSDIIKTFEEQRKALEFNPDQYRSVDGGIYDLKNNTWVVNRKPASGSGGTIGSGTTTVGGKKVLSETKQVIDGFIPIDSLTPSQQADVRSDLFALGYNSTKTPDWFKQEVQTTPVKGWDLSGPRSVPTEVLDQQWNTQRTLTLYGKKLSQDFFRSLYQPKDLEAAAKKQKLTVDNYLNNLDKTIQAYRDQGFDDKEILKMMQ